MLQTVLQSVNVVKLSYMNLIVKFESFELEIRSAGPYCIMFENQIRRRKDELSFAGNNWLVPTVAALAQEIFITQPTIYKFSKGFERHLCQRSSSRILLKVFIESYNLSILSLRSIIIGSPT